MSEHDIVKLINQSPSKSCELDPIPTAILKEVLPLIGSLFTSVLNKSLKTGVFPQDLKEALVKPLLKKANLDLIDRNYRPVSNLEFMGKTIEHAVTSQLTQHISENSLVKLMQSAYRSGHSTETALLKVETDLLHAIDHQEVACLILLDLSSAFNPVDHCMLLQRLEICFGIKETALEWIRSYLTGRTQKVSVGKVMSSPVALSFGVPQGSVLGTILFTLYTSPLGSICTKHDINYHMYADDQQIYLSFKPSKAGDKENCIRRLEMCISEIREWMIVNKIKLNDDKTEFIFFGSRQQLSKIGDVSINIGRVQVQLVDYVRNLGYHMDQLLKNGPHINKLVSNLYLQLKSIYRICKKLDQKSCKIIIQSIVQSRLDYCNSLLLGTLEFQLHKLQQIQNMACRIVCNLRR